ncbi:MAG: hypothetical protein BWY61_01299 [Firmicutes bacterium ADurb.Bin354]|nr:MAG: hypothetical protein BWY61_01299 [Firmicutes bacterium ADurb.Bin354]
MSCHLLTYNSFHSGKTDTVLVLKQLAYSTDTTVSEMVDIIGITDTVLKSDIVVDGSQDITLCDVLRDKVMNISHNRI